MPDSDFDRTVDEYHKAIDDFYRGDPDAVKHLTSHDSDVTLLGGFGGIAHGWDQVARNMDAFSSHFAGGQHTKFEQVSKHMVGDMGYIVEVERFGARIGGGEDTTPVALRVTTIFRREGGTWKFIHRQGDPLVSIIDSTTYLSLQALLRPKNKS